MIRATVSLRDLQGFDAAADEVMAAVNANLSEVADAVYQAAKTTVAFRDKTGNLRRSIKLKKSKYGDGFIVAATGRNRGGDKGYHAANVEFGHTMIAWGRVTGKRVAPHPFMRPAKEKGLRLAISLFRGGK